MSCKYFLALSLFGTACGHPVSPEASLTHWATEVKSVRASLNQSDYIVKSGKYIGMDYIGNLDPADPTGKWYHENTLTVKADSLHLEAVPVVIHKGRPKTYSSSDGGFYSYKGKFYRQGNHLIAKMLVTSHDYSSFPVIVPDNKLAQAKLNISYEEKVKRGIYLVDSTYYKREFVVIPQAEGFLMDGVLYLHNK